MSCRLGPASGPTLERVCESQDAVTIETFARGPVRLAPSDDVLRIHGEIRERAKWGPDTVHGPGSARTAGSGPSITFGLGGVEGREGGTPLGRVAAAWDVAAADGPLSIGGVVGQSIARSSSLTEAGLRVGWEIDPSWRTFVYAGWAGDARANGRTGWQAGASLAYMASERWSVGLEYRFTQLDKGRLSDLDARLTSGRSQDHRHSLLLTVTHRFLGP